MFYPGGAIAFPGLGTKLLVDAPSQSFKELCWHLPQPRSTTELQHWGSGEFSTSTSVLSSVHRAVSQGPVPLALTWSPVLPDPAVPCHVPRGGLQGHMDHFSLSGKEGLASEPSTSRASLCWEVWEQLG